MHTAQLRKAGRDPKFTKLWLLGILSWTLMVIVIKFQNFLKYVNLH